MKIGMSMFGLSPRYYPDVAEAAEANGFESLWMPEHLVLPENVPPTYLYSESGFPPITSDSALYDPWVVLGAVAHATKTLRLATNVYILPLRHPIQTARSVVTLDRVSGGRVTLGIGVGWLEEEFEIVGQDFHTRGARTDEIIGILRRIWTEDTIAHKGEHYQFPAIKFAPKPVQKQGIPIEVGGSSKAALRRAGRLGDGWVEIGAKTPEELEGFIKVIQAERKAAGREGLPFEITTGNAGSLDGIRRYQELGVTRMLVGPGLEHGLPKVDDFRDFAKRYADEVITKI